VLAAQVKLTSTKVHGIEEHDCRGSLA